MAATEIGKAVLKPHWDGDTLLWRGNNGAGGVSIYKWTDPSTAILRGRDCENNVLYGFITDPETMLARSIYNQCGGGAPGDKVCCFPDGSCDVMSQEDCIAQGGTPYTFADCDPNPCPQIYVPNPPPVGGCGSTLSRRYMRIIISDMQGGVGTDFDRICSNPDRCRTGASYNISQYNTTFYAADSPAPTAGCIWSTDWRRTSTPPPGGNAAGCDGLRPLSFTSTYRNNPVPGCPALVPQVDLWTINVVYQGGVNGGQFTATLYMPLHEGASQASGATLRIQFRLTGINPVGPTPSFELPYFSIAGNLIQASGVPNGCNHDWSIGAQPAATMRIDWPATIPDNWRNYLDCSGWY